jgi:hypothetical protein
LPDQSGTSGSDRRSQRKLTRSRRPAPEQKVRNVGAGDQKKTGNSREKKRQQHARLSDPMLVQGLQHQLGIGAEHDR